MHPMTQSMTDTMSRCDGVANGVVNPPPISSSGNIASTPVVTKAGAKFVEVGGQMKEVIQVFLTLA